MPSLSVARRANASYAPTHVPVIVITGATSGIGQAMTEIFARILNGRAHIVLIGRNSAAAKSIIDSLPPSSTSVPGGVTCTYEFIQCDVTLMKNIHAMADDLLKRLPKINFLVHCAGIIDFGGRDNTEEGLDKKMTSRYYSKFALSYDLLPLLRKAKQLGEDAKVISVFTAGKAPEIDLDDLGLEKTYSGLKAVAQTGSYNDIMLAEFARREPEIAWIHTYPGWVYTAAYSSSRIFYKILLAILHPLFLLIFTSQEDCAEHMLFALFNAEKGLQRYDHNGDNIGMKAFPQAKDAGSLLWEHSVRVTGVKID